MNAATLAAPTVRWAGGLFAVSVLLQRFAVPGLPAVALLLPVVLGWAAWGLVRGLVEVDRVRLLWWLLTAGVTATAVVLQPLVLDRHVVSPTSWALLITCWAPAVLRIRDRRRSVYLGVLRSVVNTAVVLAVVSVVMLASQYAGIPYRDWLASFVPGDLLLDNYAISYPLEYGSDIYRSNAWIGLEPSFVSAQLGLGVLAALLTRARLPKIAIILAGMISTLSGSGFAIVIVGIAVMLVQPIRQTLRRYVPAAVGLAVVAAATPFGQAMVARVTEVRTARSSTSLRAVLPYEYLWPVWSTDLRLVLLGMGPGSSQDLVDESGILGLLVPTPIKIFFDYGLLAGGVLAAFLLYCYWRGPSRAVAVALLASLWTLQPGTSTMLVLAPLFLLVTWWAPRAHAPLESSRTANGDSVGAQPWSSVGAEPWPSGAERHDRPQPLSPTAVGT